MAADHSVVDPTKSLQDAGLEDGDHLTAIAVKAEGSGNSTSFALFCPGGDRVVTGAIRVLEVTAIMCKISSRVSDKFKQL